MPECWDPIQGLCDIGEEVATAVDTAANWTTDPLGSLFLVMQDGAQGLGGELFPFLLRLTSPDLTADWWLASYAISFGGAILVMAVLLLWQIARASRARDTALAGSEVFQTIFVYSPIFIIAAAFGPVAGLLVNGVINALTAGLANWAMGDSFAVFTESMAAQIEGVDAEAMPGGVVMGLLLMLGFFVAFVMLGLMLLVQLVSLYLLGVIVPLGMVMMLNPARRGAGSKLLWAWLFVMLVRPLVVFLLGVVFHAVAAMSGQSVGEMYALSNAGDFTPAEGTVIFVRVALMVILLLVVSISPLLLLRFAPVLGQGAGAGTGVPPTSSPIGTNSIQQLSRNRMDAVRSKASSGGGDAGRTSRGMQPATAKAGGGGEAAATQAGQTSQGTSRMFAGKAAAKGAAGNASTAAAGTATKAAAGTAVKAGVAVGATAATAGVAAAAIGAKVATGAGKHAARKTQEATNVDQNVIGEERPS